MIDLISSLPLKNKWTLSAAPFVALNCYVTVGAVVVDAAGTSAVVGCFFSALPCLAAVAAFDEICRRNGQVSPVHHMVRPYLGETASFLFMWNMLMLSSLGVGVFARSVTVHIDRVSDVGLLDWLKTHTCFNSAICQWYFLDPVAIVLIVLIAVILALWHKLALRLNVTFLASNFLCALVVVVTLITYKTVHSEELSKKEPNNYPYNITITMTERWLNMLEGAQITSQGYLSVFSTTLFVGVSATVSTGWSGCQVPVSLTRTFSLALTVIGALKTIGVSRLALPKTLNSTTPLFSYLKFHSLTEWLSYFDMIGTVCALLAGSIALHLFGVVVTEDILEWLGRRVQPCTAEQTTSGRGSITSLILPCFLSMLMSMPASYRTLMMVSSCVVHFLIQLTILSAIVSRVTDSGSLTPLDTGDYACGHHRPAILTAWLFFFLSCSLVFVGDGGGWQWPLLSSGLSVSLLLLFLILPDISQCKWLVVFHQCVSCAMLFLSNILVHHSTTSSWIFLLISTSSGMLIHVISWYGHLDKTPKNTREHVGTEPQMITVLSRLSQME